MQTRLNKLGYDAGDIDGRVGEICAPAVRAYQELIGATPDGYATPALLENARPRLRTPRVDGCWPRHGSAVADGL